MKQKRVFALLAVFIAALLLLAYPKARLLAVGQIRRINAESKAGSILESCKGYFVMRSAGAEIYYTQNDRDYAAITQRLIKTYIPLITEDFGLGYIPDVKLVIYPLKEDMYKAIGYRNAGGENGKMPIGAYSAGIITVLSPSCWADVREETEIDTFISTGPVVHELVHFVMDIKTKGNYPAWFSEGAAQYYEKKYTGGSLSPDIMSGVSYKDLSGGFKNINEKEGYQKSLELVRFISERIGESGLRHIYKQLELGKSLDAVLKRELGGGYRELEGL